MSKLEITSEEMYLEIKYDGDALLQDNQRVINLVRSLRALKEKTGLTGFYVKETQAEPENFKYNFMVSDGRKWKQVIKTAGGEAEMTFDVSDFWKLSEFILHRPIRDEVIFLIKENGVTEITATWNP
jgi:hypothetical protein